MNVTSPNQKVQKGWLSRWTRKQWSRHWFVLKNGSLTYYRGPAAELCSFLDGVLDLSLIKHIEVQQVDCNNKSSSQNNNNSNSNNDSNKSPPINNGSQYPQLHYTCSPPTNHQLGNHNHHLLHNHQTNLNSHYNFTLKMWNGECHTLGAATLAERSQWLDAINACTNGELADDETSTDSASSASSDSSPTSNLSAKSTDIGSASKKNNNNNNNSSLGSGRHYYHQHNHLSRNSYNNSRVANNHRMSISQDAAATQLSLDQLAIKLKSAIRRRSDEQQQQQQDVVLQQMGGKQQVVLSRESDTQKVQLVASSKTKSNFISDNIQEKSLEVSKRNNEVAKPSIATRHQVNFNSIIIEHNNNDETANANANATANQLKESSQMQASTPTATTTSTSATNMKDTTERAIRIEKQQPSSQQQQQQQKKNKKQNINMSTSSSEVKRQQEHQESEVQDVEIDEDSDNEEDASQSSFKRRLMCFKARDSLDLDSLRREPKLIAHKKKLNLPITQQSDDHRIEHDSNLLTNSSLSDDENDQDNEEGSSASLSSRVGGGDDDDECQKLDENQELREGFSIRNGEQVRLPAPPLAKILRTSESLETNLSEQLEMVSSPPRQKKRVTFDLSVAKLGTETSSSSTSSDSSETEGEDDEDDRPLSSSEEVEEETEEVEEEEREIGNDNNDEDDDDSSVSSSVDSSSSTSSSSSCLVDNEMMSQVSEIDEEKLKPESCEENTASQIKSQMSQMIAAKSPVDSSQTIQFKLTGCSTTNGKSLDDDEDSTCEMVRRMIARRRVRMMQMSQSVRSELVKFDLDDEELRWQQQQQQQQQQQMDAQEKVGSPGEGQENRKQSDATYRAMPHDSNETESQPPLGDATSKENAQPHGRNLELAGQLELASNRVGQLERKLSDSYANFGQLELTCKRLESELARVNESHEEELRCMQVKVEELTRDLALNQAKLAEARQKISSLERQQHQRLSGKHNHSSGNQNHANNSNGNSNDHHNKLLSNKLMSGNLISAPIGGSTSAAAAKALNWLRHQHEQSDQHLSSGGQLTNGSHLMMAGSGAGLNSSHMPLLLMQHVKHTLAVNHQQTIGLKLLNQSKQIQRRLNELEYKVDRMSAGNCQVASGSGDTTATATSMAPPAGRSSLAAAAPAVATTTCSASEVASPATILERQQQAT